MSIWDIDTVNKVRAEFYDVVDKVFDNKTPPILVDDLIKVDRFCQIHKLKGGNYRFFDKREFMVVVTMITILNLSDVHKPQPSDYDRMSLLDKLYMLYMYSSKYTMFITRFIFWITRWFYITLGLLEDTDFLSNKRDIQLKKIML